MIVVAIWSTWKRDRIYGGVGKRKWQLGLPTKSGDLLIGEAVLIWWSVVKVCWWSTIERYEKNERNKGYHVFFFTKWIIFSRIMNVFFIIFLRIFLLVFLYFLWFLSLLSRKSFMSLVFLSVFFHPFFLWLLGLFIDSSLLIFSPILISYILNSWTWS